MVIGVPLRLLDEALYRTPMKASPERRKHCRFNSSHSLWKIPTQRQARLMRTQRNGPAAALGAQGLSGLCPFADRDRPAFISDA
jgi:hypothetical protein